MDFELFGSVACYEIENYEDIISHNHTCRDQLFNHKSNLTTSDVRKYYCELIFITIDQGQLLYVRVHGRK